MTVYFTGEHLDGRVIKASLTAPWEGEVEEEAVASLKFGEEEGEISWKGGCTISVPKENPRDKVRNLVGQILELSRLKYQKFLDFLDLNGEVTRFGILGEVLLDHSFDLSGIEQMVALAKAL